MCSDIVRYTCALLFQITRKLNYVYLTSVSGDTLSDSPINVLFVFLLKLALVLGTVV